MRALLTAACIVLLAVAANAQCGAAPSVDPFAVTSCGALQTCQTAFCGCVGASNSSRNATTCLATASATCTTIEGCLRTYTKCVVDVESQRTNTSNAVCAQTGATIHSAVLQAVVDSYAGSALQTSCRHHVCEVMNTSALTCNFGTNASAVCQAPDTTSTIAVRVVMKLSGSSWGTLLANSAYRAQLEVGLKGDIATLLNVTKEYIVIMNLSVGSLIVDFAVLTGSSASASQLDAAVRSSASSTSWLTSTKGVYSTVSNETITVQSVNLSAGGTTSAPLTTPIANVTTPASSSTPAPSSPPGTSPSSASSVSVIAVAAAVVALLVSL